MASGFATDTTILDGSLLRLAFPQHFTLVVHQLIFLMVHWVWNIIKHTNWQNYFGFAGN